MGIYNQQQLEEGLYNTEIKWGAFTISGIDFYLCPISAGSHLCLVTRRRSSDFECRGYPDFFEESRNFEFSREGVI